MNKYYVKIAAFVGTVIVAIALLGGVVVSASYNMVEYSVPAGDTSFKSYMNYKAITDKESPQYKIQQQATTDDDGLRVIGDYYIVAMGSYYVSEIGDKFLIYLDTGEKIKVIAGDIKANKHTDDTNRYKNVYDMDGNFIGKNVLEFIVDTSVLDEKAKNWGNISAIDGFEGSISAIYKLEEADYERE